MYRLLVVDDEFNIRDGLVNAVPWDRIGVEVAAQAADGLEALEAAAECQPDIVISDINMAQLDGLDFIAQLRTINPRVKYLILTGYSDFAYAKRALELKVSAYLLKPALPAELLEAVGKVIAEIEAEGPARDGGAGERTADGGELAGPAIRSAIRKAQAWLEEHFADPHLSLVTISEQLCLNPAYFSKLYRQETGRKYSDDLVNLRLERAKRLLRETNLRTSEVGQAVGYPNSQYFATMFRRHTGQTPSDFRERP